MKYFLMKEENKILTRLFSMQDLSYKTFQCALMPTVDPNTVIGVRTPVLRRYAKELAGSDEAMEFMLSLPHAYYEENNLHAFLIEQIGDFEETVAALERFLPYVDNWATCDSMSPKTFAKKPEDLLPKIEKWLRSEKTYTVRYAIGLLMRYFLDDRFCLTYAERVASIQSDEYYVNMMIAWYFTTALAKQYDAILPFLTERRLSGWIHNKTIQKAVESYRITDEQKQILHTLRAKK